MNIPRWVKDDYDYLEALRRSGRTNMYGAIPYLMKERSMDRAKAKETLLYWIENYDRLAKERNWR